MKQFVVLLFLILAVSSAVRSIDYLPVPTKDLVKHRYYTLSYNEKYEQANWVCYLLTDSMIMNGGEERSNKFRVDKMVPTESAKSADYTKSGYDRGHLCPAADMGFNPVAMEESFLMSNISPQAPDFNRGIWKELETTVREWAKKEHRLIVVTGPVFKDNKGTIGQENILVPGYFYKVVYDLTGQPRMIAFVLPNAKSDRPLTDFAVSADEVEKLTGLDFFSQLPDDEENKLEATVQLSGWFDRYKTTAEHVAAKQSQQKQSPDSDKNFYLILVVVILLAILFVFLRGKRKR